MMAANFTVTVFQGNSIHLFEVNSTSVPHLAKIKVLSHPCVMKSFKNSDGKQFLTFFDEGVHFFRTNLNVSSSLAEQSLRQSRLTKNHRGKRRIITAPVIFIHFQI